MQAETKQRRNKQALAARRAPDRFLMDPRDIEIIGYDTPHRMGEHKLYDESVTFEIDEKLKRSIERYGVNEAIVGVKVDSGKVRCVHGRRRTITARVVNDERKAEPGDENFVWIEVKLVRDLGEEDTGLELQNHRLNYVRTEHPPIVKARKAQALLNKNVPEDIVALNLGVTIQQMRELLKLLELNPKLQRAVESGDVSANLAKKLHEAPADVQETVAEQAQGGASLGSIKQTIARAARRTKDSATSSAAEKLSRPTLRQVKEMMRTHPNSIVQLAMRWVAGKATTDELYSVTADTAKPSPTSGRKKR